MINRPRAIAILIGFGALNLTHAAAIFDILPDVASITVSSTGNNEVFWYVTNNTKKTTKIVLNTLNGNGGNPASNTSGLTVINDACSTVNTPAGGGCIVTMGITGAKLSRSTTVVAPVFCGFNGQACSQPIAADRLTIYRSDIPPGPNPSGQWSYYMDANLNSLSFPEFLSISGTSFAAGGMDNNYAPSVSTCPITQGPGCQIIPTPTPPASTSAFTSIYQMDYDSSGNLYGVFIQSDPSDQINPWQSYIYEVPLSGSTWAPFNGGGTNGIGLGLSTETSLGLLYTTSFAVPVPGYGYPYFGSVFLYGSGGNVINHLTNTHSSELTSVIDDGQGTIYVAGMQSVYSISPPVQAFSMIWTCNINSTDPTTAFTAINMPTNLPIITSMATDGRGTLYVSGMDYEYNAHVWSYKNNIWSDTGLIASQVTVLDYSPGGYLLAGGIDNVNFNGAVWYYSGGNWTNLNLPDSSKVAAITSNANTIIAAGIYSDYSTPKFWLFN